MSEYQGVYDNESYKEYLLKDAFMRERIGTFIIAVRGSCVAVADLCNVPVRVVEEIIRDFIIEDFNSSQPN